MIHRCACAFVEWTSLKSIAYMPDGIVSSNVMVTLVHTFATAAVVDVNRSGVMFPTGHGTTPVDSQISAVNTSVMATPLVACTWISSFAGIRYGVLYDSIMFGLLPGTTA